MSKTIGNMTLKAVPVGTDMVAIADSEDSDKTKKVLLSALSGGGASTIHYLDDTATYSTGTSTYTATGSDVTQYEDKHFYVIKLPANGSNLGTFYLNINNLGAVEIDYNYYSNWAETSAYYVLPRTPEIAFFIYSSSSNKFYLIDSTSNICKVFMFCHTLYADTGMYIRHAPVKQSKETLSGATPSVTMIDTLPGGHAVYKANTALTSLTIDYGIDNCWETEFQFTTDSTFTLTITGTFWKGWLGVSAPTFDPNTSYVVAIKNGYGVYSKVGA